MVDNSFGKLLMLIFRLGREKHKTHTSYIWQLLLPDMTMVSYLIISLKTLTFYSIFSKKRCYFKLCLASHFNCQRYNSIKICSEISSLATAFPLQWSIEVELMVAASVSMEETHRSDQKYRFRKQKNFQHQYLSEQRKVI